MPEETLTKKQRREMKRLQKKEEELKKQKASERKTLYLGLCAVIAVGLAVWGFMQLSSKTPTTSDVSNKDALKILEGDWSEGPDTAVAELVEYSDFQCPACQSFYPIVEQLLNELPDDLKFVYRHFPLKSIHSNAVAAAKASEAAGVQGKFWEMHHMLFERQKQWEKSAAADDIFFGYAQDLELDVDAFKKDYGSADVRKSVEADEQSASLLGLNSTPTFFLNGKKLESVNSFDTFKKVITDVIAEEKSRQNPSDVEQISDEGDTPIEEENSVFEHADINAFIVGEKYVFPTLDSKEPSYQILHVHEPGKTLGQLFGSISMGFDNKCFKTADGKNYCEDAEKTLKLFVNGVPNDSYGDYVVKDNDQILISYGSEGLVDLQDQLDSVSHNACIFSGTCPDQGSQPEKVCDGIFGIECR